MTESKVNPKDLQIRVQDGKYSPSPDDIAKAMLRRPGLRLLFGVSAATAAGQSQTV